MGSAKSIVVKPISAKAANDLIKQIHYSGKVVPNSKLHFGVFIKDKLEGAMSFGSSMDKRKTQGLVSGTRWNDFLELNRMAFSELLPKYSESRAISIAMRLIKKNYPNIDWVVSFSDGAQCGDGTIYRASGFLLTGIKPNKTIYEFPDGERISVMTITNGGDINSKKRVCSKWGIPYFSAASMAPFIKIGAKPVTGYMLRYIYFLNKKAMSRLTAPILPFSKIEEMGAGMYKGKMRVKQATTGDQPAGRRGSTDLHAPNLAGQAQ